MRTQVARRAKAMDVGVTCRVDAMGVTSGTEHISPLERLILKYIPNGDFLTLTHTRPGSSHRFSSESLI
jgi:hypothetical protein